MLQATVTGFLAYDAVGMGKFGTQYLPFSRTACSVLVLGLTGIYIIFGGFYSLIWTEIVQTVIMSAGAVIICIIGFSQFNLAALARTLGIGEFLLLGKGEAASGGREKPSILADAMEAVLAGRIDAGDVVVIRYEGPKGGPGMREMLAITGAMKGAGRGGDSALIPAGRFSGGTPLSLIHI